MPAQGRGRRTAPGGATELVGRSGLASEFGGARREVSERGGYERGRARGGVGPKEERRQGGEAGGEEGKPERAGRRWLARRRGREPGAARDDRRKHGSGERKREEGKKRIRSRDLKRKEKDLCARWKDLNRKRKKKKSVAARWRGVGGKEPGMN